MRIIAGRLGGRTLRTVKGEGYRPAMGKTREALFSILEARGVSWPGLRILDLFAGSGSLGFEAISRGAALAVMVDASKEVTDCLVRSATALDVGNSVRVVRAGVLEHLARPPAEPFHLAFIDPPYGKNLVEPVLEGLLRLPWLAPGAIVTAEIERDAPWETDALSLLTYRRFGRTRICIWRHVPPETASDAHEEATS
jgi:16S rRNA (guanine966-N2)-methyltransferase